jgi:hypothetical protein
MATFIQHFYAFQRSLALDKQIEDLLSGEAHPKYLSDTWVLQRESYTTKVRKIKNQTSSAIPEPRTTNA